MTKEHLLSELTTLAVPLAQSLGLSLWGIELSSGPRLLLRVYLENDPARSANEKDVRPADGASLAAQGVSVEQCASFSRLFGLSLEVEDIMPGAYILEVSSPGFERTFFTASQLAGAIGQTVDVSLHESPPDRPGRKKFRGVLGAGPMPEKNIPPDARFVLRLESEEEGADEELVFAFDEIKRARQVYIVPEKVRPGKGPKAQQAGLKDNKKKKKQSESAPPDADKA